MHSFPVSSQFQFLSLLRFTISIFFSLKLDLCFNNPNFNLTFLISTKTSQSETFSKIVCCFPVYFYQTYFGESPFFVNMMAKFTRHKDFHQKVIVPLSIYLIQFISFKILGKDFFTKKERKNKNFKMKMLSWSNSIKFRDSHSWENVIRQGAFSLFRPLRLTPGFR